MSVPTTSAAAPAPASPTAPKPAPRGLLRATAIVATIGVVIALLGFGLLLRPVSTPVQQCGTSLAFLLDGRVNVYADPAHPPRGLTKDEVTDNNEKPCRQRVADQSKPAGILLVSGLTVAVIAALVELTVRGVGWARRPRAH